MTAIITTYRRMTAADSDSIYMAHIGFVLMLIATCDWIVGNV